MNVLPFIFYVVSIVLIVLVIFLLIFIFSYVMAFLDVIGKSLNNLPIAYSKCENTYSTNCFIIKFIYNYVKSSLNTLLDYYNTVLELSRYLGIIIILGFILLILSIYITAKQVVWKFDIVDKIAIGLFFVLFISLISFIPVLFSKVKNFTNQISNICGSEITVNTEVFCLLINYIPSISDSMFITSIILISVSFLLYFITFLFLFLTKMRMKKRGNNGNSSNSSKSEITGEELSRFPKE